MYINNIHNETNPIITTTSPIRDKEDETKKNYYIYLSFLPKRTSRER